MKKIVSVAVICLVSRYALAESRTAPTEISSATGANGQCVLEVRTAYHELQARVNPLLGEFIGDLQNMFRQTALGNRTPDRATLCYTRAKLIAAADPICKSILPKYGAGFSCIETNAMGQAVVRSGADFHEVCHTVRAETEQF